MPPVFPSICLQITEFTVVDDPGHARKAEHLAWLPPECPGGFDVQNTSPWYVLRPDSLLLASDVYGSDESTFLQQVRSHDKISMIFSTELNSFFEVPYSCIDEHVSQRRQSWDDDGWRRISFVKVEDEAILQRHPDLWMIGHGHLLNQMDASVNITDPWDNLLLPSSFANGVQNKNTLPTCELAGRLTLILGLVAFATSPDDTFEMIRSSFRPSGTSHYMPSWTIGLHKDRGLINKRGLIVEIAIDPNECSPETLEAWERGCNGPILTSPPPISLKREHLARAQFASLMDGYTRC